MICQPASRSRASRSKSSRSAVATGAPAFVTGQTAGKIRAMAASLGISRDITRARSAGLRKRCALGGNLPSHSIALFAKETREIKNGLIVRRTPLFLDAILHRSMSFLAARASQRMKGFRAAMPGKRVFGSLRLPDVKPPCSTQAGTHGFRLFLSIMDETCADQPTSEGT